MDAHVFVYKPKYDPATEYKYMWRSYNPRTREMGRPTMKPDLQTLRRSLAGEPYADIKSFVLKRIEYLVRLWTAPFLIRPIVYLFEPID